MSDLIGRQAVIDLLKQMRKDGDMVPWEGKDVFARIRKLPTIQPEKEQLSKEGTTSDLISRTATIDALNEYFARIGKLKRRGLTEGEKAISLDTVGTIKTLPPAQPEPKEGHWIPHESPDGGEQYECSECGVLWEFNDGTPEDNEAYFCPKCGAKMKGERQK